ncbi:MAG: hypothetical protein DMG26_14265 [Acidobacteria bacterium]|nr:MAG: hypothetical protein DMG26_14265 [Acidobacteriota bacterium]
MSDFEDLQDLLGRNTVHLRAESVSVTWTVSAEEGAVDERLEMILRVTTELRDDELKPFTHRYREGWLTLKPLRGEHERNDAGQPVVGVLGQSDEALAIRVLVRPTYLAGLSTLMTRAVGSPIRISVWPFEKLWEWNGEGWLHVRHCEVTVGSISLENAT